MKNKLQLIKATTFISFLLLTYSSIYGQANYSNYYFPEPPKAPSSEAFLKYGGVQNSEYTGSNSPSINLFNLKSGDINLPINLNYISGNGIRVTEEAGSVGLGWSISFPNIVQTVYGYDDFSSNNRYRLDFAKSTLPFASNFPAENGPTNFNQLPSFDTYGYFLATNNNVPIDGSFTSMHSNFETIDMQPDIFILNLFGEKLEFIIDNFKYYNPGVNSSIFFKVLNKKGYYIKKTTEGFTVKDPKGLTYHFNSIENIESANGGAYKVSGINYVISEIIDSNNRKILFTYTNINTLFNLPSYSSFLNYTTSYYQNYCSQGSSGNLEFFGFDNPTAPPNPNMFAALNNFKNNVLSSSQRQNYVLPSSIISENGKLSFNYSDRIDFGTKKLDKITLLTTNDIVANECQFNYDYFLPQSVDQSNTPFGITYDLDRNKRLKLLSLQKKNQEKYIFSYNETLLPPKNSFSTDYWGYANGGFNNKSPHLNPNDFNYNISIPVTELNNNKKLPDINYTKSGILEKIVYPTKGYSKFIYNLNEASNLFYQFNNYKYNKGNGLRLAEQKNYDFNNNPLGGTLFEYEAGLTPNPIHILREDNAQKFFEIGDCAGRPLVKTIQASFVSMHSSSINNTFALSSGSGVGYTKVTKKEIDSSGNTKGRIETIYSNIEDIHYNTSSFTRPIFLPSVKGNKFENGTILNTSIFDNNSIKLKEEKYNYTLQNSDFSYGVTMIHPMYHSYAWRSFGNNQDPMYVQHYKSAIGYYPIYSTETILKDKETIDYLNGNSLSVKTDYTYDGYNLISSKKTTYPTLETMSEQYKYSHQNTRFYHANILSTITEKSITKNSKVIFKQNDSFSDSDHFNPTATRLQNFTSGFTGDYDITYDKYDVTGNLLQYTKRSGASFTIIWGYNQTLPIAIIEGATYPNPNNPKPTDISQSLITSIVDASNADATQINGNDETAFLTILDNFRKDPLTANFKITTYTYDPLIGVRSITSSSGNREFYRYDISTNKLEKVLDQDNNVVKEYKQKFAPSKYYNSTRSQTFTRNNCGSNSIGGPYTYTVQENKYSSYNSQADADQQAQTEINNLGQSTANSQGTCTLINCSVSMNITPGGGGMSVAYPDYKVQLSFSSGVGRPWTTDGVLVAKINGSCRPLTEITKTSYNGGFIWSTLIRTNGELLVKKLEGLGVSGVPNNTTYNLEFTFPIN